MPRRLAAGPRDWDDFTSIPYRNPWLNSIARRAATVDLPLSEEGEATKGSAWPPRLR